MTKDLEQLLNSTIQLEQNLSRVLPREAVDYIMLLITKDKAHRKYLNLTIADDKLGD